MWRSARRADGPLDPLVGALRAVPPRHRGDLTCPVTVQEPMFLALTDASGQVVIPAIPTDACGFRLKQVDRAMAGLRWVTVDAR